LLDFLDQGFFCHKKEKLLKTNQISRAAHNGKSEAETNSKGLCVYHSK